MKSEPTEHRWAVDVISEGSARVEEDGGSMITVPAWLLPVGTKEGQLLRMTRSAAAGSVVVTVALDEAGTAAALAASAAQVESIRKASGKKDAGGDVAL